MTLLKPIFFALTLVNTLGTYRFEYLPWQWRLIIELPLTAEGALTLLGLRLESCFGTNGNRGSPWQSSP
jgi:hypothetical protein